MHSGKKPQCILVKSDEFENSYSLLYFFLNPVYVAARSLRSLRSNYYKWHLMLIKKQMTTNTIELYHTMLNKRFCPSRLSSSVRLDGQKQSFLFSWDSKWPPCDKGLFWFHYLCSQCYAAQHSNVPLLSIRRDSPSKSSPTFSVRPCSSVGRVTEDLIRRSWVRFPPRSKDFFFASCGSLFPFTRANAQWVIHGFM